MESVYGIAGRTLMSRKRKKGQTMKPTEGRYGARTFFSRLIKSETNEVLFWTKFKKSIGSA
jgi:hypothetical protein